MSFPLAEVMRIGATVVGTAVGGPAGGIAAAVLTSTANEIDKEDDPSTPAATRKMKQKRREGWIKFALKLEKEKQRAIRKAGKGLTETLRNSLNGRAASELRAVIASDIWETEERVADEQEVNLYAEAASARARQKL